MSERIILESLTAGASTSGLLTLGQAATEVAKASGKDSPDGLAEAKTFIARALDEFTRDLNLRIKGKVMPTVTLSSGESRFAAPTDLDEVQHLRVLTPTKRPLRHLDRKAFTERLWSDDEYPGEPFYYMDADIGQTGEIEIWPVPTQDTEIEVAYIGVPQIPGDDNSYFDLPSKFMVGVLTLAKGFMLRDCGSDLRRAESYLADGRGAKRLTDAADKTERPDELIGFRPGYALGEYGGNYRNPRTGL